MSRKLMLVERLRIMTLKGELPWRDESAAPETRYSADIKGIGAAVLSYGVEAEGVPAFMLEFSIPERTSIEVRGRYYSLEYEMLRRLHEDVQDELSGLRFVLQKLH